MLESLVISVYLFTTSLFLKQFIVTEHFKFLMHLCQTFDYTFVKLGLADVYYANNKIFPSLRDVIHVISQWWIVATHIW